MKRINEDIVVNDPSLSNKYMLATRQINDRLKKIAQLQSEIVKYKQEMAKIEAIAIKKQAATIKATNQENDPQAQAQQQIAQQQNGQIIQSNESRKVPTFEEFLKEEEMKLVKEALNFEQGADPYKTMDVGPNRVGGPISLDLIRQFLFSISKDSRFDPDSNNYSGSIDMKSYDPREQEILLRILELSAPDKDLPEFDEVIKIVNQLGLGFSGWENDEDLADEIVEKESGWGSNYFAIKKYENIL